MSLRRGRRGDAAPPPATPAGGGNGRAARLLDEDVLRALARVALALSRGLRGGEGARRGARRGGRVEFAGHRAYVAGDDVRTIDWGAHARTGRWVVKEFEAEEGLDVLLVLDASASMGEGGKFGAARRLAYAIGWVALRDGARVRVATAAEGAVALSDEASGAGGAAALGEALSRGAPAGGTRLAASVARLPAVRRGRRLVVVVSDLLGADDARPALAALCERGDEVVVVHVHSAADFSAAEDADTVLEDAETGERVAVAAGADATARRFAARSEEDWREFAGRHGLRYVPVDAGAPFDRGMVRTLRAVGLFA